jgi:CDP-glucose 4,6-dehydratase
MEWSRERVLVTGATGFIGGNLAARLLEEGAAVFTIERDRKAMNTLKALGVYDQVTCISGDIADGDLMIRAVNEHEITFVYHLAAQAIVTVANRHPISTFESNIKGTWSVLEAARQSAKVKGVIVASSDKAYGVQDQLPYTEDGRLLGRFPYDASKVCTDVLAQSYYTSYGLKLAITRNANTYGPGDMNWSRLIPECIRCAVSGKPFEIRSDGQMQRDYMYVGDAVDGYLLLAASLEQPDVCGRAFNFGTGEPHSVLDVAKAILEIAGGTQLDPIVLNQANCEIPIQYLDVRRAAEVWGWSPKVSLSDGLTRTVDWYRSFLERAGA